MNENQAARVGQPRRPTKERTVHGGVCIEVVDVDVDVYIESAAVVVQIFCEDMDSSFNRPVSQRLWTV
jgi:hypothetical protein